MDSSNARNRKRGIHPRNGVNGHPCDVLCTAVKNKKSCAALTESLSLELLLELLELELLLELLELELSESLSLPSSSSPVSGFFR